MWVKPAAERPILDAERDHARIHTSRTDSDHAAGGIDVFRRLTHSPATLLETPLGDTIPRRELAVLDTISTPVGFAAGRTAMTENAIGRECMMVVEGSFAVERAGVEVAELHPGDFMGEMALLAGRPRNATVRATEDSRVYAFSAREFRTLLRECPVLASRVLADAESRDLAA